MGKQSGVQLRAAAAEIVDAVVKQGRSLDVAIQSHEERVSADDRSLLRLLCYGALRRHWQLQAYIAHYVHRPIKKKDSVIKALLAIGIYQIIETRIPDHAVLSQTVEAARLLRRPKHASLINAVLRQFLRDTASNSLPDVEVAKLDHPEWLLESIRKDWPEDWNDIISSNNARAPMWLRVNSIHGSAADYQQTLRNQDVESEVLDAAPAALRLLEPQPVESLPGFDDGRASVQDAAAQFAAPWLLDGISGPILDACAAPGGKSGHLLEFGGNNIDLTCIDKDERRLRGIEENLDRLKLKATISAADASKP